jgi:hypothetical protein
MISATRARDSNTAEIGRVKLVEAQRKHLRRHCVQANRGLLLRRRVF